MYSKTVDRCWSLRLPTTFKKANRTMPHANSIIHSSVDRRRVGASSGGWLPSAGEGIVMLFTRPSQAWSAPSRSGPPWRASSCRAC